MTAADTIAHGVKVFSQEIADLRHSLHISKAQAAEKDQRIAELEDMLRRVLADEWTVLHQDIEDAARAILAKKA